MEQIIKISCAGGASPSPTDSLWVQKKKNVLKFSTFFLLESNYELVLVDADDDTGADGTAALADSEAEALLDGDGGDQLDVHVDVVAG